MKFLLHFRALMVSVAVSAVIASPVPVKNKRAINCATTDKAGSALTSSSADSSDEFATCTYQSAGECTYFFANGNFSSGSSTCPAGLPQDAAATNTDTGTVSTSGTGSTTSTAAISPNVNCPATDKEGTALTASSDDSNDEFATCTYEGGAGECSYFFASGDFSSGSSNCPEGLPQTATAAAATTSATTAAAPTTTEATTSSSASVLQATTSSATQTVDLTTSSTTDALSTSATTVLSTDTSATAAAASASSTATSTSTDAPTTTADAPTTAAAVPTTDDTEPSTTDVTVVVTIPPSNTASPVGAAAADTNAAPSVRAGMWGVLVPVGVLLLGMI